LNYGMLMPSLETYVLSVLQFKYRGRFNIALDIMDHIMRDPRGKTKTQIKEDARLSYDQLNKYLDLLLLCDFIAGKNSRYGEREITRYVLTQQGLELVKQLQALYFAWSFIKSASA